MTSQKLAASGVATGNLAEKAVTPAKLANDAVTAAKLAPGSAQQRQPLKSGQTLRGVVQPRRHQGSGTDASAFGAISFQLPLAANPAPTVIVPESATRHRRAPASAAAQPTPEAAAGQSLRLPHHRNQPGRRRREPR